MDSGCDVSGVIIWVYACVELIVHVFTANKSGLRNRPGGEKRSYEKKCSHSLGVNDCRIKKTENLMWRVIIMSILSFYNAELIFVKNSWQPCLSHKSLCGRSTDYIICICIV
jgi:hypothetical protein